jgi:hypothetical protein
MNADAGWLGEKLYNRTGRPGAKTLVGNWAEEGRLETDVEFRNASSGFPTAPGAESSPFLVSAVAPEARTMAHVTTEQRAEYTAENGDLMKLRGAGSGVRAQLRAQMVLDEARLMVEADTQRRADLLRPAAVSTAYRDTHGSSVEGPPVRTVVPDTVMQQRYASDVAVTLYSGDPVTGEFMATQGRTGHAEGARNPQAKNSAFSMDKYQYALSRA